MDKIVNIFLICSIISYSNGVSFREQLEHIIKRRQENRGGFDMKLTRRFDNGPVQMSVILGSPSMASHLPEAEAMLPGHTLIRPALGMLKSAVKFPHRILENGAGVYGNIDSLGIRYDGKNERVLYSGFRRMPEHLIMVVPKTSEPRFSLSSKDFNLDEERSRPKFSDSRLNINTLEDNPLFIKINSPNSKSKRSKKDAVYYGKKRSRKSIEAMSFSKSKKLNQSTRKKSRYRKPSVGPGYAYVNLEEIGLLRTGEESRGDESLHKLSYNMEDVASDSSDDEEADGSGVDNDGTSGLGQDSDNIDEGKKAWFWKTKDAYNHIKINPGAPDHEELMPSQAAPKIRDWWFYHQGDLGPLNVV